MDSHFVNFTDNTDAIERRLAEINLTTVDVTASTTEAITEVTAPSAPAESIAEVTAPSAPAESIAIGVITNTPAPNFFSEPEIMIPCFKNLPEEILSELIRDGKMFATEIFEENYDSLPNNFKERYTYAPVQMIIDEVPETIAFRIVRRNHNVHSDED